MTSHPQALPPVPEATLAAVQAAFPRGNLYVALRAEFSALYDDQLFTDLYLPAGRPLKVAPWRLALVMVTKVHRRAHRSPGRQSGPPLHGLEICAQSRLHESRVRLHPVA
jgi:hypothetical protein